MFGDAKDVAELVRCRACCDARSDIELLRNLYRIIDLYAEIPHSALILGLPVTLPLNGYPN